MQISFLLPIHPHYTFVLLPILAVFTDMCSSVFFVLLVRKGVYSDLSEFNQCYCVWSHVLYSLMLKSTNSRSGVFNLKQDCFIPWMQTFITRKEGFIPRKERFIPRQESFIPWKESNCLKPGSSNLSNFTFYFVKQSFFSLFF